MRISMMAVSAVAACAGAAFGQSVGPDVIVGDLIDTMRWGATTNPPQQAYSVGTTSCNIGTVDVQWVANNNRHPVIGQNMFRLKDGKFEQIGLSWLKHGFTALTESLCQRCNGHGGAVLGVGCSDPYVAQLNGSQGGLGPRYQVNPYTGVFSYPVTGVPSPTGQMRRLLVANDDINPALNVGARYFVEGQYVTQDDAAAGNGFNNQSWREVRNSGSGTTFTLAWISGRNTHRMEPALKAWASVDPEVTVRSVRVDGEGEYWVGSKVTFANGVYSYEYAVQNNNSDRAVGAFHFPLAGCAAITNHKWHGVNYHSGEPYDNSEWVREVVGGEAIWRTAQTFAQNPNSNALRWGTLQNFRFESPLPPRQGTVTMDLFKPGTPNSVTFQGPVPRALADFTNDGFVDQFDYDGYVAAFESGAPGTDVNGDGFTDFYDYDAFVGNYEAGC